MRPTLFIAILLATVLPQARADVIDIQWSAEGRFTHQAAIAAGKVAEICGKLAAGQSVRWRFEASAPLDFNVHYHVGKEVEYPARLSAVAKAEDSLNAKTAQDYCWMWSNKSAAPATLSVTLQR